MKRSILIMLVTSALLPVNAGVLAKDMDAHTQRLNFC